MTAYRILAVVARTWLAVVFGAFLAVMLMEAVGAPKWLPLPWSGFGHFAEGTDGRVYVSIWHPARVLCYDAQGRFLASYRSPSGGTLSASLASDLKGRIFCRGFRRLTVRDGSWQLLAEHRVDDHRAWRLDENGDVVPAPSQGDAVVDRAAAPRDYIFSYGHSRESFACMDGSRLVRKWNHLERYSPDGQLVARYAAHWILYPLTFPWAFFGSILFAALVCEYVPRRRKRLSQQLDAANVTRALLLDVTVTIIIAVSFAAVWLTVLIVVITDTPAWSQGGLIVFLAIWFFLVPWAGVQIWSAVQKRLIKLTAPRQEPTSTAVTGDTATEHAAQSPPQQESGQQDTGADA